MTFPLQLIECLDLHSSTILTKGKHKVDVLVSRVLASQTASKRLANPDMKQRRLRTISPSKVDGVVIVLDRLQVVSCRL